MATPQDKDGRKAAALTNVKIAVHMLEEALPIFDSESKEGAKIMSVLKALGPMVAGGDTSDLVPAEVMQMVQNLPQQGGGTDVQRQIMQMMRQGQGGQPQQQQPQPGGARPPMM